MLSKTVVKARPSVLWCYKKDLGFSSHRKKRMKSLQKKIKSGKLDVNEDDPFELFVISTNIRYCYYNETHKILGNTYGMCVLQVCIHLYHFLRTWICSFVIILCLILGFWSNYTELIGAYYWNRGGRRNYCIFAAIYELLKTVVYNEHGCSSKISHGSS